MCDHGVSLDVKCFNSPSRFQMEMFFYCRAAKVRDSIHTRSAFEVFATPRNRGNSFVKLIEVRRLNFAGRTYVP